MEYHTALRGPSKNVPRDCMAVSNEPSEGSGVSTALDTAGSATEEAIRGSGSEGALGLWRPFHAIPWNIFSSAPCGMPYTGAEYTMHPRI